jgi:Flp pilus assembly protein TadG
MHRKFVDRESSERRGAALVELAICLPVMIVITLGMIETTNAIYLKQTLTSIAYEGARLSSATGGTTADAEALCARLLEARHIEGASVTCTQIVPSTPPGTPVKVTISAPMNNNSIGVTRYFRDKSLKGSATMPRL